MERNRDTVNKSAAGQTVDSTQYLSNTIYSHNRNGIARFRIKSIELFSLGTGAIILTSGIFRAEV